MTERGMKKWRPFAALPEYADYYKAMKEERKKVPLPLLSEDQIEEIDSSLRSLCDGDEVLLEYFTDGYIKHAQASFISYSIEEKTLVLSSGSYSFKSILSLDKKH